mmetsp:Transcript_59323/g.109658  ORF Transcript_59323/g.109658 Transcript_59323/m.109658 type:complete len:203 (+) Transcript_59323:258-866(+)
MLSRLRRPPPPSALQPSVDVEGNARTAGVWMVSLSLSSSTDASDPRPGALGTSGSKSSIIFSSRSSTSCIFWNHQVAIRLLKYMRVARSIARAWPRSRRHPATNSWQSISPRSSVSSSVKMPRASEGSMSIALKHCSMFSLPKAKANSDHVIVPFPSASADPNTLRTCRCNSLPLASLALSRAESTKMPVITFETHSTEKQM